MLSRTQILLAFAAGVLSTPLLAQQPSSAKLEIEIKNFAFTPNRLVVQQGDTITWTNRDFVRHDITAADKSWKVRHNPVPRNRKFHGHQTGHLRLYLQPPSLDEGHDRCGGSQISSSWLRPTRGGIGL